MGSLAWAGVIGGAGTGLREHVKGRRAPRMQDDEQAHQVQIQIQRDKAAEDRASAREDFDVSQADVQQERDVGMADVKQERDVGLADVRFERDVDMAETLYEREAGLQERDLTYKAWQTIRDNESDEFQAMFRNWSATHGGGAGSKGSAGEWDIEILPTFDETGPGTRMISKHPSGISMEQVGDKMVHTANPELRAEGLSEFEDPEMQVQEERKLWNELDKGNDTGQEFLKEYKYLPHWYMVKKFEKDNANQMGGFWGFFNRNRAADLPDFMKGRLLPRSTQEVEGGQSGGRGGAGTGAGAGATPEAVGPGPVTTPQGGGKTPTGQGALTDAQMMTEQPANLPPMTDQPVTGTMAPQQSESPLQAGARWAGNLLTAPGRVPERFRQ